MVKRSMSSALRPLMRSHAALANPAMAIGARHFSATPVHGVRALFTPTENEELNQVLDDIQSKIILPAFLPPAQRKLVFNPKMRQRLEQNPIEIEIEGLQHKFSSIDLFKDIPNSKKALRRALSLMKTKEDWANLPTLFAGLRRANIALSDDSLAKTVRETGQHGDIYRIIECAKSPDQTGIYLARHGLVIELLFGISRKIFQPKGEQSEVAQALKWTELVLDLIQRPEHSSRQVREHGQSPLHMHPVIRSLVLYTQASAAQAKIQAGEPAEAELRAVGESAEFLTSAWARESEQEYGVVGALSGTNPKSPLTLEHTAPTIYVQLVGQIIKGMEMARELVGAEANGLKVVEAELQQHVADFVGSSPKNKDWLAKKYEGILGRKPNSA